MVINSFVKTICCHHPLLRVVIKYYPDPDRDPDPDPDRDPDPDPDPDHDPDHDRDPDPDHDPDPDPDHDRDRDHDPSSPVRNCAAFIIFAPVADHAAIL